MVNSDFNTLVSLIPGNSALLCNLIDSGGGNGAAGAQLSDGVWRYVRNTSAGDRLKPLFSRFEQPRAAPFGDLFASIGSCFEATCGTTSWGDGTCSTTCASSCSNTCGGTCGETTNIQNFIGQIGGPLQQYLGWR